MRTHPLAALIMSYVASTYANVLQGTIRTKGFVPKATIIAMVLKLIDTARRAWRFLDVADFLTKMVYGVKLKHGVEGQAPSLIPRAYIFAT